MNKLFIFSQDPQINDLRSQAARSHWDSHTTPRYYLQSDYYKADDASLKVPVGLRQRIL